MPSSASSNITATLTKIFLGVLSSASKLLSDVLQHNKFPTSKKHKKLQNKTKNQTILQKHFRPEAPVPET